MFGTALAIVVGTIPAALAGVLAEDAIAGLFANLTAAGVCLCVTGLILLGSRWAPAGTRTRVTVGRGLAIGLAQSLALLPGISRSGITIVAGRLAGLDRRLAGRFSFLLAVPALAGAAVLELIRTLPGEPGAAGDSLIRAGALASGVLVSTLVGTVSLLLLLRVIERGRLHWFAAYCLPAGAAMLLAGVLS
jgi:undecaprenyl-diphosphatase